MNLLCLDFGGTFIKRAIVDDNKKITPFDKVPSVHDRQNAVTVVTDFYADAIKNTKIDGIAISMYGVISDKTYIQAHTRHQWNYKFDFKKEIENKIPNLPVHLINDGKASLVGAIWNGEVDKSKDHIAITVGTGLGGAFWINGKIGEGVDGGFGEISNFFWYDNDKGTAIAFADVHSTASQMLAYKKLTGLEVNGEEYFKAVEDKNASPELLKMHSDWISRLGIMLVGYTNSFNPASILLSGGIFDKIGFFETVKESWKHWITLNDFEWTTELKMMKLTNNSNLLGAAYNWLICEEK